MSDLLAQQSACHGFEIIPSIDVLGGQVVRLLRGEFDRVTSYGTVKEVLDRWSVAEGSRLHVVDLEGSRTGTSSDPSVIAAAFDRGLRVQIGGGVRSADDVRRWLDRGVERVVVGTMAAQSPRAFEQLVASTGGKRILPALDLRDGQVRVEGWIRAASRSLAEILRQLEDLGIVEILVTDISVDGTMQGPAFDTYRRLADSTRMRLVASGGVGSLADLRSLARQPNLSGVVIGRALHEERFDLFEAAAIVATRGIPERLVPCLDIRNGRVVKGTKFEDLRDAGDPALLAERYEAEGADEIVVLDVSATQEERRASLDTIRAIAEQTFIPVTVGGGVRTVDDFRTLLQTGADRVAINTAAVARPALISECAAEFGVQSVVVAVDARARDASYEVVVRSGTRSVDREVVGWCAEAEQLGAGEILLTSIDRDGTAAGFDLRLLRAVTSAVRIGVIASGGAGKPEHFRDAIEVGGARAVLAASLFHDQRLRLGDLKDYLDSNGIAVRR